MNALTVSALTKSFRSTMVLRGIDLSVPPSSLTAILGPSGCGKTTFLRLIAGFIRPDSGTISIGDAVVAGDGRFVEPQQRAIGYVPQEGALFPHLSVAANIAFGLSRSRRDHKSRVHELLELVGLEAVKADRFPHELSGGQQQRVALARALAPSPALVLLDEPFASLDASLRESTGRAVAGALRTANATGLLVTHDQDEALSLADQVAVMRDGRLAQVGAPQDIYRNPVDTSVAEFVGAAIVLQATVHGSTAQTVLGSLPLMSPPEHSRPSAELEIQGEARVLIRPEQIRVHLTAGEDGGGHGHPATVLDVSYYGHDASVRLALQGSGVHVIARVLGMHAPSPNTLVNVTVDGPVRAFPAA